jgi:hypothetical protein
VAGTCCRECGARGPRGGQTAGTDGGCCIPTAGFPTAACPCGRPQRLQGWQSRGWHACSTHLWVWCMCNCRSPSGLLLLLLVLPYPPDRLAAQTSSSPGAATRGVWGQGTAAQASTCLPAAAGHAPQSQRHCYVPLLHFSACVPACLLAWLRAAAEDIAVLKGPCAGVDILVVGWMLGPGFGSLLQTGGWYTWTHLRHRGIGAGSSRPAAEEW